VLQALREPPVKEEHVELEDEVDDKADYESGQEAREARSAENVWNGPCGGAIRGAIPCCRCRRPFLAAVLAFPNNIALPSLELDHHDYASDQGDDQDEGPQEFAHSYPDVRTVGESNGVEERNSCYKHTDPTVDFPFWVDEEQELAIFE